MMCQLQNFSKDPSIFFLVQATVRIFLQFKITGSKFQKPNINIQNLFNFKVATLKTFSF